jgi:hypothetical protein
VTEPVGASTRAPDPPIDVVTAHGVPPPTHPPAGPTAGGAPPPGPSAATLQLMSAHARSTLPSPQCIDRAADVAKGAGGLVVAAGALAASGAAGPVGAFIGASMIFGAVLAQFYNCEVDAAQSRAKTTAK